MAVEAPRIVIIAVTVLPTPLPSSEGEGSGIAHGQLWRYPAESLLWRLRATSRR